MTAPSSLRFHFQAIAAVGLICVVPLASTTYGQNPPAEPAAASNATAADLYDQGDYEAAGPKFEKEIADFPAATSRFEARFKAGHSYFLSGKLEKAMAAMRKSLASPAPNEIKALSQSLLAQTLVTQASQTEDPAKRKELLEKGIAEFNTYIDTYKEIPGLDSALYGRAVAYFQNSQFDKAVTDLKLLLEKFPESPDLLETKLLLAMTTFTQANAKLMEDIEANREAAFAIYDDAVKILEELEAQEENLTISNDAKFQLAEVMLSRASASPREEQPELFKRAIESYRTISSKDQTILEMEKLIAKTAAAQQGTLAKNPALYKRLTQVQNRYRAKLAAVRANPDQTKEARLKVAQAYFQIEDYDAARVIYRYIKSTNKGDVFQKPALYSIAMSYSLQGMVDPATEAYEAFRTTYKGDQIAANLSLAMGAMFLAKNEPEKALAYFETQQKEYPKGELAEITALQTANAYLLLERYDEALKTFKDYLANNPKATPEARVQAAMGIANIYKDTGKLAEALPAFDEVRTGYPTIPQAVGTATFWIGSINLQTGKPAVAVTELEKFIANHEGHQLESLAMFTLAQGQAASGKEDAAVETYTKVAQKHPDSDAAIYSYFQRGQVYSTRGDLETLRATMREFLEKYPEDDKVFIAYETIANSHLSKQEQNEGIAVFVEFSEKYPDDPHNATALLKQSNLQRQNATSIGRFTVLDEEQRVVWNDAVAASILAAETSLKKFPESDSLAVTLTSLLESQKLLITAKRKETKDIEAYFQGFADEFADKPATRSKVLFTLASFIAEEDPARAITIMEEAYDPSLVYAPDDLDSFGSALIANGKLDLAQQVYTKLTGDYPNPEGGDPKQAPARIQDAQSRALYGLGKVLQEQGDDTQAATYYDKLKQLYPWSPKILEATYGIAARDFKDGELDKSMDAVVQIIRARTATIELRANAMLLGGFIQKQRYETTSDAKEKEQSLNAAIDYFIKIARLFEGVPKAAEQGLWEGGLLLEKQIKTLKDPKKIARQKGIAKKTFAKLASVYPDSEHAAAAKKKAAALTSKK